MYNRGLFHDWVPKPLMLLLIIYLLIVYMLINAIYSSNISLMTGSTGILSEYFTWSIFATTIGLGAAIPLIMRVKMRFRSKEMMLSSLLVMAVMSVVIATTDSAVVVVGGSLIFGFFKMFGMVEIVLPIRGILSPNGDNGRFYSIFYPIAIGLGQVGALLSANIVLDVSWQMLHYYTAALLLVTAMLCIIFMHNLRFAPKMSLKGLDWFAIVLFIAALLCFTYVVTFGKQQDWFTSPNIRYAAIGAMVFVLILVIRELNIKQPLLMFNIYKLGSVRMGLFLLVGQGIFMSAAAIQTIYTSAILGYNWMNNASLGFMMLTGIIFSGFVAFYWTKFKIPLKMYIFTAFSAYVAYYIILYFMMVPGLNIERFFLPQFLNGYGMCGLFISLWIYTLAKVPAQEMIFSVAPVMVFRSVITTTFFTGIIMWVQYSFQLQGVVDLAFYFDGIAMSANSDIGSLSQVQLSALLAANKKLLGYIIVIGLAFLAIIFFHQFGNFKYRIAHYNVRKTKYKYGGKPSKAAIRDEKENLEESIGDIAGII